MKRQTTNSLDVDAGPTILQVLRVKANGIVQLRGRDGKTMHENSKNVAPCNLPDVDGTVVFTRAACPSDRPCRVCDRVDSEDTIILCDVCLKGYHMDCPTPPLAGLPAGEWICPEHAGEDVEHVVTKDD